LGFEVLSARLVGGANVDATELIKLNEALATYMPKTPPKMHELVVRFVGGIGELKLTDEQWERAQALSLEIDALPVDDSPETTVACLKQNEALRRRIDVLEDMLAAASRSGNSSVDGADNVRVVPDRDVLPPAKPQRQLPSPAKADEAAAMGWTNVLGGGAVPWTAGGGYHRTLGE
jgi:hypothetical protein